MQTADEESDRGAGSGRLAPMPTGPGRSEMTPAPMPIAPDRDSDRSDTAAAADRSHHPDAADPTIGPQRQPTG